MNIEVTVAAFARGQVRGHVALRRPTVSSQDVTTSYSGSVTTSRTSPGVPDHVHADIEQARVDLGDTLTALTGKVDRRTRIGGALSAMKRRTASGVSYLRAQVPHRAPRAVRNRAVPAAVGSLTLAGAVAAVLLGRRAAKARSARSRRLTHLLHR
ncbi:hypothetical protein [Krasilnikovia sp. M28-CT-15]|uniref:hypothetical protein n=1 Tax=Krasilnikovia sp. M28-CT-15 TaxID=3373540 RepID=UPI00387745A4